MGDGQRAVARAPGQQRGVACERAGRGRCTEAAGRVRRALRIGGGAAHHLGPVDVGRGAAQGGVRGAGDGLGFMLARELLQRQPAPQVGRGGVPRPALLARDEAGDQARQVVLPGGLVHHRQQQARGVDVAARHQPPPLIVLLGAEGHARALHRESRAQDLLCL